MEINEIGRVVIQVPDGAGSVGLGHHYVAVALELHGGVLRAESVTRYPEYTYSIIGRVCDSRAVEAVGGGLLMNGKEVTPEAYLKAWREAIEQAVSPQVAMERHGVKVTLIARGSIGAQKGKPAQWTYDPKRGFDDWCAELGGRMYQDGSGYFSIGFDLSEQGGYKTWDILCGYRDHRDNSPLNAPGMRVELVAAADAGANAVAVPEQACLFA